MKYQSRLNIPAIYQEKPDTWVIQEINTPYNVESETAMEIHGVWFLQNYSIPPPDHQSWIAQWILDEELEDWPKCFDHIVAVSEFAFYRSPKNGSFLCNPWVYTPLNPPYLYYKPKIYHGLMSIYVGNTTGAFATIIYTPTKLTKEIL